MLDILWFMFRQGIVVLQSNNFNFIFEWKCIIIIPLLFQNVLFVQNYIRDEFENNLTQNALYGNLFTSIIAMCVSRNIFIFLPPQWDVWKYHGMIVAIIWGTYEYIYIVLKLHIFGSILILGKIHIYFATLNRHLSNHTRARAIITRKCSSSMKMCTR